MTTQEDQAAAHFENARMAVNDEGVFTADQVDRLLFAFDELARAFAAQRRADQQRSA